MDIRTPDMERKVPLMFAALREMALMIKRPLKDDELRELMQAKPGYENHSAYFIGIGHLLGAKRGYALLEGDGRSAVAMKTMEGYNILDFLLDPVELQKFYSTYEESGEDSIDNRVAVMDILKGALVFAREGIQDN